MQNVNWAYVDDAADIHNLLADTLIDKSLQKIMGVDATFSDYLGGINMSFMRDLQHFDIALCAHSMSVCFRTKILAVNSWDELYQRADSIQPEWKMFIWEAEHTEPQAILCDSPKMAADKILQFCQQKITSSLTK